jgi:hypothetical protein
MNLSVKSDDAIILTGKLDPMTNSTEYHWVNEPEKGKTLILSIGRDDEPQIHIFTMTNEEAKITRKELLERGFESNTDSDYDEINVDNVAKNTMTT